AGNTFYGRRGIFEPAFLEWLERDFRLSDYELSVKDGQFHLAFDGLWTETTMWELYALSIIGELKTRAGLKKLREFGLDILYARAKTKLWGKIERLRGVPGLAVADFGTRRRHRFLELWQSTYEGALRIMLPDTFGTSQFLDHAPDWTADWTGQRIDSKNPYIAGDEYVQWLNERGRDPHEKLIIASDALDVDDILGLHAYFGGALAGGATIRTTINDFRSAADFLDPKKWTPG